MFLIFLFVEVLRFATNKHFIRRKEAEIAKENDLCKEIKGCECFVMVNLEEEFN